MFLWCENIVEEVLQQHCDHRMRRYSHIICSQTRPKTTHAFVLNRFRKTVQKTWVRKHSILVLTHSHKLCLHVVEWQWYQRYAHSWNCRCCQPDCHCLLLFPCVLQKVLLCFVVWHQLRRVYWHCSDHCWNCPCPQSSDSFFFTDSRQSIDYILVVSSFSCRQAVVWLKSDQRNICWIGDYRPDRSWK